MRRLFSLTLAILGGALLIGAGVNASDGAATPAWAAPSSIAVKRVSDIPDAQNEPNLFSNLDCTPIDYHLTYSSIVLSGCFTPSAFGAIDSDSEAVIFNGTDEGLPLLPYLAHQVLVPWPKAGVLVSLQPALISGAYLGLYTDPLGGMSNQRDGFGQLTAKQMTTAPDLQLRDPADQPLIINPQTLAFSEGGSWLVAEDLNGSFIRINSATLEVLPFAPSISIAGNPSLLKSQVAITEDGRYVAINNEAAGSFKLYDLATCDGGTPVNLEPLNCASYDYRSYVAQRINGLQSIRHVRFVNDGLISFEVRAGDTADNGVYELAPTSVINSLIDYLGLGDSYTSGEGAFDYLAGTDTVDNSCHLSLNSYPLLLSKDLFGGLGGHSVACSGATISDVDDLSDGYKGQAKGAPSWQQMRQSNPALISSVMANFSPGYVAQQRFVQQYQPAVTTVSVGGNDIGFGDVLQECVEPKLNLHASSDDCFDTYEDRLELENLINSTTPKWTGLYQSLRNSAPGTRLYATGYPQIVYDEGSCSINVHLSQEELEFTEELTDYLNGAIKQAADKAGVAYVDISQALHGHRLCEASGYDVAVNGLTAGNDAGALGINFIGKESYHPNALGQQLIEEAILQQTHNFEAPPSADSTPPSGNQLLDAPKSGRTVYVRVPVEDLTSGGARAGQVLAINITGDSVGLEPDSTYAVRLDGPTGPPIGSLTSDDSGNVAGSVTVPDNTGPGGHSVDVTGTGQDGEPVDATQPIYVPAGDDDSDGDGSPNGSDSCPYAVNSGVDSDHDGIDDTCDPLIGSGSDSGPTGPGISFSHSSGSSGVSVFYANLPSKRLAVASVSPSSLKSSKSKVRKPLTAVSGRAASPINPKLRTFAWLPWLILPVLAWLLMLIVFLAWRWLSEHENRYSNGGLSTTIS